MSQRFEREGRFDGGVDKVGWQPLSKAPRPETDGQ